MHVRQIEKSKLSVDVILCIIISLRELVFDFTQPSHQRFMDRLQDSCDPEFRGMKVLKENRWSDVS